MKIKYLPTFKKLFIHSWIRANMSRFFLGPCSGMEIHSQQMEALRGEECLSIRLYDFSSSAMNLDVNTTMSLTHHLHAHVTLPDTGTVYGQISGFIRMFEIRSDPLVFTCWSLYRSVPSFRGCVSL